MRSDRMWSLPISPAAAIIYESIHSGALNGSVDSDGAVRCTRPVDFEAKPKELTGRSRSVSKDFTEQMKLIHKHTTPVTSHTT